MAMAAIQFDRVEAEGVTENARRARIPTHHASMVTQGASAHRLSRGYLRTAVACAAVRPGLVVPTIFLAPPLPGVVYVNPARIRTWSSRRLASRPTLGVPGEVRVVGEGGPGRRWLDVSFWLPRRVESPRLRKVETLTPYTHIHSVRLTSAQEIDDQLTDWLRQAYEVGCQQHLRRFRDLSGP